LEQYRRAKAEGRERPRLPLVIPLRDYAKAIKVDNIIAGFFFTKHNIRLNAEVFDQLNRMGKLLLIFDGFDEMAARVDRQQMINQFWELAEVVKPGAKVILTCRTEHFPEAREGRRLLNAELQASTADLKGLPAPRFEVLELEKFTDEQIRRVLGFQVADAATIEKVMGNGPLLDLARRPVMTELVIEALPEIEAGKPIDLSRVYLYAVQRKMERDIRDGRTFTSIADKLFFLCELSWEMLYSDRISLNYRDFPNQLKQLFSSQIQDEKSLDYWKYDMMGESMLIRNAEGDYTPAHRSLLEFFVAYKLVAMMGVIDADFLTLTQRSENQIDYAIAPQAYRWNDYFQRSVDAIGNSVPMAAITNFEQVDLAQLYEALRDSPIAKAVLDLAVPMLDREVMRDRMLGLIQTTQGKTPMEVGYFGGNIVKILTGKDSYALEKAQLNQTVLRDVNFANLSLRQANLNGAILQDGRFHTVLNRVNTVAYSPDGGRLAIGDTAGRIQLLDVITGKVMLLWQGHQDWVRSVTFSPDGQRLASDSADGSLTLWNAQSGELELTLEGHQDSVRSVVYSPNGQRLASGSDDRSVKLWNAQSGDLELTLEGHQDWIWSVVFSPDGSRLASGSDDGTMRIWDVATGECLAVIDDRLCGGLNITGVQGLTPAQRLALKAYGAFDEAEIEV
jgi:predicted NACHT family NTPase